MDSIRLYLNYISLSIRSQLMYKTSFVLMSTGHFLVTLIEFIGVIALFDRFGSIYGWYLEEVALFYGIMNVSFALAESFGRGYDLFARLVVSGEFDRYLLRPRSFMLQIMGMEVQLMRIGRFMQGFLVMLWAGHKLGLELISIHTPIIIFVICGTMFLFLGLFVIQATVSFWSIQSLEVMNAFTYGGVQFGQYPINIYKKWFQRIFTYIIPLGTTSYYPIAFILGKNVDGSWLIILLPSIGILFFAFTLLLFNVGVKHYKSTGS